MGRIIAFVIGVLFAVPAVAQIPCPGGLQSNCPPIWVNQLHALHEALAAATTGSASFSIIPGVAPTSPADGDLWVTSTGWFGQAGGVTIPFGGGGSLTLTDGTHTVTGTTQITVAGGTVGGSTPNGTLTISASAASFTPGTTTILGATAPCALVDITSTTSACLAYGLTGNSALVETTSGGLLTPSILPLATTGAFGAVKPDGSTITISAGVISAISGGTSNLPVINASQAPYNVKCDNSTNDTAAIQSAINAAGGNAATIIMPSGICLITGGLTITTNGINFIGQGGGNGPTTGTAIVTNQATGNALTIGSTSANVSGVTIQGISISPSVTRTGGAGIYRYSGAWNILRDVKIVSMWQGYVIDGRTAPSGTGNSDYDNYVYGGSFNSNSHGGIVVGVSGNTTANNFPENEFFYNPDVSVNGIGGLVLNDCGGCNLSGVQGILNDVGVMVSPGNSQAVGIFSTDLQLDSSKNAALDFAATGTGTFQGQWANAWLTSSGTAAGYQNPLAVGIRFNSPVSAYGALTFVGGKIFNNAGPGVYEAQNPKYVTFTGVDGYSNSAYNNGSPVCPTSTPVCNNNNVYPNYLATNGTTNVSLIGGNWGVGAGLLNWPSYGYDIGGGSFTDVAFVGINVNGTASSGTCSIGGATLTGGIRCGGSTASSQAGILGVTVSGGAGSGNVTNTTSGSGSDIMTCAGPPGCTTIAPSSLSINGSGLAFPPSNTVGTSGNGFSGLVSVNNPSWAGLISGTIAGGNFIGLNGSGQVVLGAASGGGTVTTAGGSTGTIADCNNSGCTQIVGTGYSLNSSGMAFPASATVGTGGNGISGLVSVNNPTWTGLLSGTVVSGGFLGLDSSNRVVLGAPSGGGNVSNTTGGGAGGGIMTCVTAPACTNVASSAAIVNGGANALQLPSGWFFEVNGTPMAFSGSNGDITSLTAVTSIKTGVVDVANGFKFVTQAFSGSAGGNILSCADAGCDQIAGSAMTIGSAALAAPDNTLALGTSGNRWTVVYAVNGTIQTSDRALKTGIEAEPLGLAFIETLKPITYNWKDGDDHGTHHGLIAQDVEEALHGAPFAGLHVPANAQEVYGLNYTEFTAPMIRAIQQQSDQIRTLRVLLAILVLLFVVSSIVLWRKQSRHVFPVRT